MSLNVWLIRVGEPLPIDNGQQRMFRMGLIADEFTKLGDNVTWYASTFDHNLKQYRYKRTVDIQVKHNYSICLLHGRPYKKNISFKRILHYYDERKQFERIIKKKDIPDVILASMPNIDLALAAVKYGKKNHIPVFIDVRDLWPDLYEDYFVHFKKIIHYAIVPFQKQLSFTLKNATGIFATSEKFLDWALMYAGRKKSDNDYFFYVSYPNTDIKLDVEDEMFWRRMGLHETDLICVFFGQFGHAVNLELVIKAALITAVKAPSIKYVICGAGEKDMKYKNMLNGASNVMFPGWVNRNQICALGKIASVGILSYKENKNFEWSMPNKFAEYLALGLSVVVEPPGMMAELIAKYKIGFKYRDETDLAEYLVGLLNKKDKVAEMKKRARELYEDAFMAETTYSKMVQTIKDLVGKE